MRTSSRTVWAGVALFLVIGLGGLAVGLFGVGSGDRYALAFSTDDLKLAGDLVGKLTSDDKVDDADRRRLAEAAKEINKRHGEKPFSTTGFVVMGAGLLLAGSLTLASLISKSLHQST